MSVAYSDSLLVFLISLGKGGYRVIYLEYGNIEVVPIEYLRNKVVAGKNIRAPKASEDGGGKGA